MNKNNRLIIAAAGSGKTTFLVKESLKAIKKNILITTYTWANEGAIREKFIKINRYIPKNITIQTWFSFLIQHGVKPFQCRMGLQDYNCRGLSMVNGQSAKYIREDNIKCHYFSEDKKIYSDKLSKFVVKNNAANFGAVINRLTRVYDYIYIDEFQDLAGYDLEFIKLLLQSNAKVLLVGDPRQCTYVTNNNSKNKQFKGENIINFFKDSSLNIEKDDNLLTTNHRSHKQICNLSNKIYPEYKPTNSSNTQITGHDGVFLIKKENVEAYLSKYQPILLRANKTTKVSSDYRVYNFGASKGLEFDRALIYPNKPLIEWLKDKDNKKLKPMTKSKFYVAITRAKFSVGIVSDTDIEGFTYWNDKIL